MIEEAEAIGWYEQRISVENESSRARHHEATRSTKR